MSPKSTESGVPTCRFVRILMVGTAFLFLFLGMGFMALLWLLCLLEGN